MNLNQAAHGDREFGYIQTRLRRARKTVAGHVSDPRVPRRDRRLGPGRRAAAPTMRIAAAGPVRRQHARRRRHRGRQGRGAAALRRRRSTPTASTTWSPWSTRSPTREVDDAGRPSTTTRYDVAPELRPGGDRHESLRYARPDRGRPARRSSTDGGFGAFTTNFEDLGGLRQLPGLAVQRLMADGYGFGGEGDWKTAVLLRTLKAMAPALPGGTSFMEDYTYHLGAGPAEDPRRAHARGLPQRSPPARRRCEIHPLGIGGREDPVRLVFDAAPGPAVVVGLCDLGDRFRLVANEIDVVAARRAAARSCRSPARSGSPQPDLATSAEAGSPPAARTTPCCRPAVDDRGARRLRRHARRRTAGHRRRHQPRRIRRPDPLEPGVLPAGARILGE